jgi:hypothetical protein
VANFLAGNIEKFTLGGVGSNFANTGPGGNEPVGLAFDSAGNLYSANEGNNTIEEFTSGGVGSDFANTGFVEPEFIAIEPAREPSTIALLGLSLPALFVIRRKFKK